MQFELRIAIDRPLIYSEFGGESLYGQDGDVNKAWYVMHDYYTTKAQTSKV